MTRAYYNEIDEYCAGWLRNLMTQGLIADGDVDTRSIADVTPNDVKGYTQCHFFAGIGGWSGALRLSGVWPDRRAVWTGSCPCQPFSLAGKQGGFDDQRHLWPHWQWLIEQCCPATILGEQVASAAQWLWLVRGDLEAMGYAVGAIPVEAASAGADHLRDRFWFVGHDTRERRGEGWPKYAVRERSGTAVTESGVLGNPGFARSGRNAGAIPGTQGKSGGEREVARGIADQFEFAGADMADADFFFESDGGLQRSGQLGGAGSDQETCDWVIGADGKARRVKPGIRLLAHGVPARVAKLRALGNAIDLRPAAEFIKAVSESLA